MQQSPRNSDKVSRRLSVPTQPPRPKLLDPLRQAFRSRDGIRTIGELLGYNDIITTMIYMHVLDKGKGDARSLVDGL